MPNIKKIDDNHGTISRVVPGRLLYIDCDNAYETVVVTPENVKLKQQDGKLRNYRGEPFKEIGLRVGRRVKIIPNTDEKKRRLLLLTSVLIGHHLHY